MITPFYTVPVGSMTRGRDSHEGHRHTRLRFGCDQPCEKPLEPAVLFWPHKPFPFPFV
jgi:hypothetical protein